MEATVKLVSGPSSWKSNGSTPSTNATSRVLVTPKTQTNFPRDSPVCDALFFQRVFSGPPPSLLFPFSFHFSPYISPRITLYPPSLNSLARRSGYSRYFHYSRKFIARHVRTTFRGYPANGINVAALRSSASNGDASAYAPLHAPPLRFSPPWWRAWSFRLSSLSLSPLPPLLLFAPLLDVLTLTRATQCTRPYCSLSAYRCNYRPAGLYTG